jgi:BASS family bile acid:Na+ symporter
MKYYWILTLLLLMVGVGMSLDARDVLAQYVSRPRGYWIRVVTAAFLAPPLVAMAIVGMAPLAVGTPAALLLMAIAPGAPLLTRMVSQKGSLFEPRLAAAYQILVGLLVPVCTSGLLVLLGRYYHRDVWVSPGTLAVQVASLQFAPLVAGLAIRHYRPGWAEKAAPWMSRAGNVLLVCYLLVILFGLRRVLLAVGPVVAVTALGFALACLAIGHLLAGPTIALSNTNRHTGLAVLVTGLNFQERTPQILPFVAAYALLAPLVMGAYAVILRKRHGPVMA